MLPPYSLVLIYMCRAAVYSIESIELCFHIKGSFRLLYLVKLPLRLLLSVVGAQDYNGSLITSWVHFKVLLS